MSLPGTDIFPDFIVLTLSHERSADYIPIIFEVTLKATKPRTLVYVEVFFFDAIDDFYHH